MRTPQSLYTRSLLILAIAILSVGCGQAETPFFERSTSKQFDDVIQDVEFIISEQNFRITNRLHIGKAIRERGATDFPRNEVILFCNLSMAEEMLRLAPQYINYCPYKIAIAEIDDSTTLSTWLMPQQTGDENLDAIAKNINKILRSMIEYGASDDPFILEFDSD